MEVILAVTIWYYSYTCWLTTKIAAMSPLAIGKIDSAPAPDGVNGSSMDLTTIIDGYTPPAINFPANSRHQWANGLVAFNATVFHLQFDFSSSLSAPPKSMRIDSFQCPPWGVALTKLFVQDTLELPVAGHRPSPPTTVSTATSSTTIGTTTDCVGIASTLYNITGLAPAEAVSITIATAGVLYLAEVAFYVEGVDSFNEEGDAHHDTTENSVEGSLTTRTIPTDDSQHEGSSSTRAHPRLYTSTHAYTLENNSKNPPSTSHPVSTPLPEGKNSSSHEACHCPSNNCFLPTTVIVTTIAIATTVSIATTIVHIVAWLYCHARRKRKSAANAAEVQSSRETLDGMEILREERERDDIPDAASIATEDNQCYIESKFTRMEYLVDCNRSPASIATEDDRAEKAWPPQNEGAAGGRECEEELYESVKLPMDQFSVSVRMNCNDAYQRIN